MISTGEINGEEEAYKVIEMSWDYAVKLGYIP